MKVYYEQDADFNIIKDKKIVIIGFGSQGHAHALNLKDSGASNVVVGLREGSSSIEKAKNVGLKTQTPAEAVKDADIVMFVYREEYYLERKEPKLGSIEHAEWQSKMNDVNGLADIILGKQRHGPTGTVKVEFEGIYTKFKDLSKN